MVRQSTACNECRKLRRKCVRSSLNEVCDRCVIFNRECSFPGKMGSKSNSDDVDRLLKEVEDLNLIISELEAEMRTLQKGEQRLITYSPKEEQEEEGGGGGYSSLYSSSNRQWNITIHQGKLRIETGIRNISDLLRSQPIRYLSPRLSPDQSNQDLVVHFNIGRTMRIRMLSMRLFLKCLNPKPTPTALLLPTSFLFDSTTIIDKLICIYFECFNFIRPYIHQVSFMKYYEQISSPIDDLICLCICCVVCCAPCDHVPHSYEELRSMGDYFAGLAKSKILDQFDLPEKRLENVIAINMLVEYFYAVLNVPESLKLISMAFQICQDLKPWYDKECQKPGIPSVECMLFSRHYTATIRYIRLSDVIINRTQQLDMAQYIDWKYRPDEPEKIIECAKGQNRHYQLTSHPVMAKIRLYRHHLNKDSVHELKFTDIILVDDIVLEWWRDLPPHFRVADDWLNSKQLKAGIDSSSNLVVLVLLAYFLSYMNDIYATLLTPNDADAILTTIQERALKRCLHCSQLTVYAIHRLTKVKSISRCDYTLAASECLSHTLDVLSILAVSSNFTVRKEAKDMLSECMNGINDMKLLRNQRVDPMNSPLLTGTKENDFSNLNPSVYYNYPHPWYAAVYDICHFLEKMHLTTEEPVIFPNLPIGFE